MKTLTAITGGIGAGKSVVCRVLRTLGYHVYDCDSAARRIMDTDTAIQQRLIDEVDTLAVTDGIVDRPRIARIVFADARKLDALNAIVHAAVLADIADWVFTRPDDMLFVETAILYTSGLSQIVDAEWRVTAPTELRIKRAMKRSNLTRAQVEDRIRAQQAETDADTHHHPVFHIYNDDHQPVLPQILPLLGR